MRHFRQGLLCLVVLMLPLGSGGTASGASGPTTFTVHVIGGSTKTVLHLQPGFATVLRSDHRVDTVAIGDPRLVTATTVKRGQDVYDLVLQPQTSTGVTNMIVWLGDLTSIWELTVGPGQRTADIVYVVSAPPTVSPPKPPLHQIDPSQPLGKEAGMIPLPAPAAPATRVAEPYLEAQQVFKDATGAFQLSRGRSGVMIRYRITNQSARDFSIRASGILLRVNGRLVSFGMSRENTDRNRPGILPSGATEAGTINAPVRAPRYAEVIFSLFPSDGTRHGPTRSVPTTFQLMFTGLEGLPASSGL